MNPNAKAKAEREQYCARPAEVEPNSGLPKYGYHVQHAMIPSDGVVRKAIFSLQPEELPNDRGWILKRGSVSAIAYATRQFTHDGLPMARRTVAHRLRAMERRGMMTRYDDASRNSPFGANWLIPRFATILDQWAADPTIGTIGKRAFYVIGKGRRHLSPEELTAWKLDSQVAARLPRAQAAAVAVDEPGAPQTSPAIEATQATAAPQQEAPAPALELQPLMDALNEVCTGANLADTQAIWREIFKTCGKRPAPEAAEAAAMVYEIGRDWRKVSNRNPITIGLMKKRITAKVERWQLARRKTESQRKALADQARTDRTNLIISAIQTLGRGDADADPEARAFYEEIIRDAAPDELAAARRNVDAVKARSA